VPLSVEGTVHMHPLFKNCNGSDAVGLLRNWISRYLFISDWAVSLVGALTADCFADKNFNFGNASLYIRKQKL